MAQGIVHLDDSNFETEISQGLTLVDFYADWCGPCRMIAPIIAELATEFSGQVKIAKFDVGKGEVVATKYEVTSIPTIILFKDGKKVGESVVGLRDKATLKNLITLEL
jgi:thioredoxin 1